jgi:hypothetical protein
MSERFHRREERARADVRSLQRGIDRRYVFGCLAGATAVLALAVGFLMTIIDFVSANEQELTGKTEERHAASAEETRASHRLLVERLEASEEKLDQCRA